jgi:hypothetical protein
MQILHYRSITVVEKFFSVFKHSFLSSLVVSMFCRLSNMILHVSCYEIIVYKRFVNKGFIVSLLFLAFLSTDSLAQVLIGPVAGTNVGWVAYDSGAYDVKPTLGFNVGASISFRVRKKFFLQSSLLFSRKVKSITEKKGPGSDADFSNVTKLNYLEMPILYTAEFKGKLGKKSIREFKWYLGLGPTVSYWLGGKGVISDGDLLEANIKSQSYKITFDTHNGDIRRDEMYVKDANRIQLAINISAGLILEPVGLNKFMISMRYEFGHSYLSPSNHGKFGVMDEIILANPYQDNLKARVHTLNFALNYFIDMNTDQRNKGKSTSKVKKGRSKN